MPDINETEFVAKVKNIISVELGKSRYYKENKIDYQILLPSKMLRTHMGASLSSLCTSDESVAILQNACAAIELIHTASLCHDDVIDNGLIRRGSPTLWRTAGKTGAVLIGDHLMCNAMDLLLNKKDIHLASLFVRKIMEMCTVEIEHELNFLGKKLDEATCLRIARGKTGSLFSFIGYVSGGDNNDLALALEEAGYRIGTAYQLFDDLLDIQGSEDESGKTLGLDSIRGKFTLPTSSGVSFDSVNDKITTICMSALESVNKWPEAVRALESYIEGELHSKLANAY